MGTVYLLKCQDFLKLGFTSQPFEKYLSWLQARMPFRIDVLRTRTGTIEEEKEFHSEHTDFLAEWGGREWYTDSREFRQEAIEFLTVDTAKEGD
jgi:hypothetical protein